MQAIFADWCFPASADTMRPVHRACDRCAALRLLRFPVVGHSASNYILPPIVLRVNGIFRAVFRTAELDRVDLHGQHRKVQR